MTYFPAKLKCDNPGCYNVHVFSPITWNRTSYSKWIHLGKGDFCCVKCVVEYEKAVSDLYA